MTTIFEQPSVRVEPSPVPVAPAPVKAERRWVRYLAVGLLSGAVGLAAGFGLGYASRNDEVASLTAQAGAGTTATATYDYSIAREHLAQAPGGWAGWLADYDYSSLREHLAQAPGGWAGWLADYDYSVAREHLAQQPS
jgi:hypothetical protein